MNKKKFIEHIIRSIFNYAALFSLMIWLALAYDLPNYAIFAIGAYACISHMTGWFDAQNGF